MTCTCDKLIGSHEDSPSTHGLTHLESTEDPDKYGLVLYSAKYRCNACGRELTVYGENKSQAVSVTR